MHASYHEAYRIIQYITFSPRSLVMPAMSKMYEIISSTAAKEAFRYQAGSRCVFTYLITVFLDAHSYLLPRQILERADLT